ncbi:cytochrome c oxidase copper chaperone-like protein [Endogone sp. FLAS-F59071]|nr:cytochrome c oxidase copper chaperone-like protein [Endogone sp. FLAS-F59071]|eukprot:RUS22219.1 cytochrome c oxidase copper chaperone-like protein [Endogone sp. FLAS-F59071]
MPTTLITPTPTPASTSTVSTTATAIGDLPIGKDGKPLKPCCACPETKKPRDQCIFERGEENCGDLIEAHKQCMRNLGFKV